MTTTRERESRPAGNGTATQKNIAGQAVPTIAPASHNGTDDALTAEIRDALNAYAVLVVRPGEDRYRRRIYMSLHSATRAAHRAEERGQDVRLVLVRLVAGEVLQ